MCKLETRSYNYMNLIFAVSPFIAYWHYSVCSNKNTGKILR